jgi:hypothetical protein
VELLLDTDFIIKMARYSLLDAFHGLMKAHGHAAPPFRYLYEIKAKMRGAERDPTRSEFGSHVALNSCRSFIGDGLELDRAQNHEVFEELREIEGMHLGEAQLVEYMLREANALMVSGDKKMVNGLKTPDGDRIRPFLQRRIIHLERIMWTLAEKNWDEVRQRVCKDPDCDAALYDALQPSLSEIDARAKFFKMMVEYERFSRGLLRPSIL